jgi:hypothetical protein
MGLYEKIYNVMNESEGLEKDLVVGTGASSYKAVGEKEVLNMLKPLFKKHKLIVFPVDGDISETNAAWESEYNGKKETKTRNVTQLKAKFKIVDIETGESECLMGFGNGADSQDKGSGKAFTYAFKTMLSKTFMLFSGEDTDNEHSDDIGRRPQNPPQQNKPVGNDNHAPTTNQGSKNDSGGSETATKAQVAEVFKAAAERKEKFPGFDLFKHLEEMLQAGRITTKYTYADKAKTKVNWTQKDVFEIMSDLELPF